MAKKIKIGLALSGGGYRAAAFHLGVLKKLKEMGILDKLHALSTISGGSIAGVYYLLNIDNFEKFQTDFRDCLKTSVILKVIFSSRFIGTMALLLAVIAGIFYFSGSLSLGFLLTLILLIICFIFLYSIIPLSDLVERAYKKIFFGDKKLNDLPNSPKAAINSTNLETGLPFVFSKYVMSDSSYYEPDDEGDSIKFLWKEFPLSVAVSASTAVPFPFNPIRIKKQHFQNEADYQERANPNLVDGGVYDNQGFHKLVTKKSRYLCDIIICSDGSAPFKRKFFNKTPLPILIRVNNVMMSRVRGLQAMLNVFYSNEDSIKEITYFSIDWRYEDCVIKFVENLRRNQVRKRVVELHQIPGEIYGGKIFKEKEIIEFMKRKIEYERIIRSGITEDKIEIISRLKTSLHAFTDEQIDMLSAHGAALAELQVNLYCPTLLLEEL